jgi:hypothetical protein
MEITLNSKEINKALISFVTGKLNLDPSQNIHIEYKAGRGENGPTASIIIDEVGSTPDVIKTEESKKSSELFLENLSRGPKIPGLGFTKTCSGEGLGCKHGEGYPCLDENTEIYKEINNISETSNTFCTKPNNNDHGIISQTKLPSLVILTPPPTPDYNTSSRSQWNGLSDMENSMPRTNSNNIINTNNDEEEDEL